MATPPARSASAPTPGPDAVSSMAPAPSTVAAAAMSAVTAGVAIPSLRPLSTFSERRMERGSDSSDTTLALSAASVGAKTAPSKAASSHGRSVSSAAASPAPSANVRGSPTASKRVGSPAWRRRSCGSIRAASANRRSARVTSASRCTECDSTAISPTAQDPLQRSSTCGDEHDRTGHIEPFQAARQHRPREQEDEEGDQSAGAHA